MKLRNRITRTGAGLALVAAMSLPAVSAYANQPAEHFTEDVTGDAFDCGDETYTITSGEIRITIHEGESASGNQNFTGTVTPRKVVAVDSDGDAVDIRGALWFGGTMNAQRGTEQFTFTGKLRFIDRGTGTVDSVNQTFHITLVNGEPVTFKAFDFGTCQLPE